MQESKTHEIKFMLKDLNCANCSVKIENKIKGLKEVSEASLDFITKTLRVRVADEDVNQITENINHIVKFYEPDVEVIRLDQEKAYKIAELTDKAELIKLAASIICFAAAELTGIKYLKYLLLLISYLLPGWEVILKSAKNIKNGRVFDENFLMTIATFGAIGIGQYPEAAAVMIFYSLGEFFQDLSVNRSRKSILALMDIKSDYANLKSGNKIEKVSPEKVKPGDVILIKPGERVPLDGTVIKGQSAVDTSPLTGEPVPRDVRENDNVLSGFINKSGVLMVQVTREFGESTVSKILKLVENASGKKSVTENFITRFARVYTPAVVMLALMLAFAVPALLGESYSKWIYRALVFLVVSCPCALVLSVPLSFFSGIGLASKNGILVKGTNYLESLAKADCVVFDKTGTLTKGVFKVNAVIPSEAVSSEELLEYAAYGESYSNHPIAISVVNAYAGDIRREDVKDYIEIPGQGIKAHVFGKEVLIGNKKLMEKFDVECGAVEERGTTVYAAVDRVFAGIIVISDQIKEDSRSTIGELKDMGIKAAMLTGDVEKSAAETAKELNIAEYYCQLLPDEKVYEFEKIQERNNRTVFVGDGINDAPVLARADIGIAMGALGSDAAVEAADVVIMTDEPFKVIKGIKIAKRTKTIVWQNIIFILAVKVLVLVLGALGYAAIWEAVFADVGVAVIAVLNSLRVFKI